MDVEIEANLTINIVCSISMYYEVVRMETRLVPSISVYRDVEKFVPFVKSSCAQMSER